ncbi:hypothetical protein [Flavobacterium sp.]|uniref:hypothetical protein n=1 Tax=Flavobacterium sp. TaxID=239 RepID=UPI003D6B3235
MTYDMLGNYSFEQMNASDFRAAFEIPDNCFYNLTEASGEYTIAIKLNPGEKEPSTSFKNETATVSFINNTIDTIFEQYEKSGAVIRKPRVVINE